MDLLLDGKGIRAGQADQRRAVQRQLIQLILELAVFVVPENDAARVVLLERRSKASIKVLHHFFGVHGVPPFGGAYFIGASTALKIS